MKVKYPKIDLRSRCHWVSKTTSDVLRVARFDWRNYHVLNVVWFYNKEGW